MKHQQKIKGSLVVAGGGLFDKKYEIFYKFMELAKYKDDFKIGILPTASQNPARYGRRCKEDFIYYGIPEEKIQIIPIALTQSENTKRIHDSDWTSNASDKDIAAMIKEYSGIWIIGGDQLKITDALIKADGKNSRALNAMWKVYKKGGVIGGTSAGAAVMSDVMIGRGNSISALKTGCISKEFYDKNSKGSHTVYTNGIGFYKHGIIDQHFNKRNRLGRLIAVTYANRHCASIGFGIDEDTALIVCPKGSLEVIGKSKVTVVDISHAQCDSTNDHLYLKNINTCFLQPGLSYSIDKKNKIEVIKKNQDDNLEFHTFEKEIITNSSKVKGDNFNCYDRRGKLFDFIFKKDNNTRCFRLCNNGFSSNYSIMNASLDIIPCVS